MQFLQAFLVAPTSQSPTAPAIIVDTQDKNKRGMKLRRVRKTRNCKLGQHLPSGSWGFFKSSSVNKLSSSIKSESASIWTAGEVFGAFLIAKDEPIFQEGFLALTYDQREERGKDLKV